MKTPAIVITVIAVIMLTFSHAYAQDRDLRELQSTPPKFPAKEIMVHGQVALSINEYLMNHVLYPAGSAHKRLLGTEVVQFEVSETGTLSSFKVINSISREIDQEVIRVLETTSGNWIPGTKDGLPSSQIREVSLVFKPNEKYDLVAHAREFQDKGNRMMFLKKDPKRALKFYNQAIMLLPSEESILAARCCCKCELGDEQGALRDLERILALNPNAREQFNEDKSDEYFAELRKEVEQAYLATK
jgi:TonB family protein